MKPLDIIIADDDELVRIGLELVLNGETDLRVAGTASDGEEALRLIRRCRPDIVLLDLQMPVMDGLTCIQEIRKLHADLPILILTTFSEEEFIFRALAYGANGYLLKGLDSDQLASRVREAAKGRYLLPADIAASIARYVLTNDNCIKRSGIFRFFERSPQFNKTEQTIMLQLLNRLPNKEIAESMHFSEGTIKNYLTTIYEKLSVRGRKEAVDYLEAMAGRGLHG
ncbi:response regulator transcription factor [Paenibacillus sp. SYP-B4298]|uniref:response regulator transcription factor n=1 Tax=Paenibacillus sp. SYP-B4298 TaxID=2996034 RepID=UPI0022DDE6EB|nr:response regulator transcription factor [Paenibacillus sp. SYP-B4298]